MHTHVYRPGLGQYVYVLSVPGLVIALGLATIVYGFTAHTEDWNARLPWGLFVIAVGLIPAAYILGMRVELTDERLSKIFLFGLLRETIPLGDLACDVDTEDDGGYEVARATFMNARGRGGFGLYRSWVWSKNVVDHLIRQATQPWPPNATIKRQNGRLIGLLALVGVVGGVLLGIRFWGSASPGP